MGHLKLIIAGPRDLDVHDDVVSRAARGSVGKHTVTEVVCGEARGVDTAGREWAEARNIPVASFPAKWNLNGRGAGHIRNAEMAGYGDALLVIRRKGISTPGTSSMIRKMLAKGKPVYLYEVNVGPHAIHRIYPDGTDGVGQDGAFTGTNIWPSQHDPA